MTSRGGLWQAVALVAGSRRGQAGLAMLAAFGLLAVAGPWLAADPSAYVAIPHEPPSWAHLLGTTGQGQDVLAQLVAGTRASLGWGLLVGVAVVALGAAVGVTAGYAGGALDAALSLATNVLLVVPSLPLAIVVAAYLPPGPWTVALVLVATGWAWNARVLRVQALSLREREHVKAALVAGETHARIVLTELLPNMAPLLVSQLVGATGYAIGAQVGLEFLGLGDVSRVTWGSCLYWASNDQALLTGAWWTFGPTGASIALVGLALTLVGTAVDEAANPALRAERGWRRHLRGLRVEPDGSTPVAPR